MSDRDTIAQALLDAIGWQEGLVDTWPAGSAERAEAHQQVKKYKSLLRRRYGTTKTKLDKMLESAKLVSAYDFKARQGTDDVLHGPTCCCSDCYGRLCE